MRIPRRILILFGKLAELGIKLLLCRWFGPQGAAAIIAATTIVRHRIESRGSDKNEPPSGGGP